MRPEILLRASALLAVLQTANGAPTSNSGGNPPLRGSEDLLGYSPDNVLTDEDTDAIKFTLVPGQKDDARDGVYLDFEHADNPQPIRGTKGANDPGPRMCDEEHPMKLEEAGLTVSQATTTTTGSTVTSLRLQERTTVKPSTRSGQWVGSNKCSLHW